MRIAMVSEHASPLAVLGGVDAGGQNVHVAALARALAARGCEVVIHTRRDDPDLPRRVELSTGVVVDHVDAGPPAPLPKDELLPFMDEFAAVLERRWRRDRPHVVHSHFWMSGYAALRAADALTVPVVHTYHALGVVKRRYQGAKDTSPPERLGIEDNILRQSTRVICTCTDEAFELMRLGADRGKLAVIPCGADLHRFRPVGPREPRRAHTHRLACVGRLVQRKGVGNVISALAELPDTELVIAGGPDREQLAEDPEARRLSELAEHEGVGERVELRGRVSRDDLPALLRSADIVVCAPWYEPFGMVPLEAMACGVPVVATAVGGMVDTVVDGVTGVHVPPRDPERLAGALRELLADPATRERMGRAGLRRARERYDWDRIAAQTHAVYDELRQHGRRGGRGRRSVRGAVDPAGHVGQLLAAIDASHEEVARAERWGRDLAERLVAGARLLALGNGGSAAQAQHLTAELVGRFETERTPLSALCLHGDTSSLTAVANDYGYEQSFARQVRAHGRPGDVLLALSTSGTSANVLAAAREARECGLTTWAMTGPGPNPLTDLCDDAVCVPAPRTATVQELHLVAMHVLCQAVDGAVAERRPTDLPLSEARR
jgi:type III pantothenate kinase